MDIAFYEDFCIDSFFSLDDEMYDGQKLFDEAYTEASTGMTKQNVGQKILNFMKKIVAAIKKGLQWLYNKLVRKKNINAEDVAKKCGIAPITTSGSSSDSFTTKDVNYWDWVDNEYSDLVKKVDNIVRRDNPPSSSSISRGIDKIVNDKFASVFNYVDQDTGTEKSVTLTQSSDALAEGIIIDMKSKNPVFKISKQYFLLFSYMGMEYDTAQNKGKQIPFKTGNPGGDAKILMRFILHQKDLEHCADSLKKDIVSKDFNKIYTSLHRINNLIESSENTVQTTDSDIKFTLSDLMNVSKILTSLMDVLDQVFVQDYEINDKAQSVAASFTNTKMDSKASVNYSDKAFIISEFNRLAKCISNVQMAITNLTDKVNMMSIIPKKYNNSCNDINKLANFVNELIIEGCPTKYVAYNAYLIAGSALNNKSDASADKPILGQSRCVLFPSKDKSKVIKLALNPFGRSSNNNEKIITDEFKKYGETRNYIAPVLSISDNKSLVTMERCSTKKMNDAVASKLRHRLEDFCDQKKFPYTIADIHGGNVGINREGNIVAIDYGGFLTRSTGTTTSGTF